MRRKVIRIKGNSELESIEVDDVHKTSHDDKRPMSKERTRRDDEEGKEVGNDTVTAKICPAFIPQGNQSKLRRNWGKEERKEALWAVGTQRAEGPQARGWKEDRENIEGIRTMCSLRSKRRYVTLRISCQAECGWKI